MFHCALQAVPAARTFARRRGPLAFRAFIVKLALPALLAATLLLVACGTRPGQEEAGSATGEERTGALTAGPPPYSEGAPPTMETTEPDTDPPVVVERKPAGREDVFFIKRAPGTDPLWPSMGAAGELVVDAEGCVRLRTPGERPDYLLEWPPGFSLSTEGGELRILNSERRVAARVGDEIRVDGAGGGTGRPPNLPRECRRGEYWSIKDVSASPGTP